MHSRRGTFQSQVPKFEIVSDTLQAISDITDDSDVLLYNFSQIDHDKENLNIFYESEDWLLQPLQSRSKAQKGANALQILMDSYENDRSKTIEEFFETDIAGML